MKVPTLAACRLVPLALCVTAAVGASPAGAQDAHDEVLAEFNRRVGAYVELHHRIVAQVGPFEPSPDVAFIHARRKALTDGIRTARGRSQQGEIFIPAVRDFFRARIARQLLTRPRDEARAALEEVPRALRVRVNTEYPADAALATVPPILLAELPQLPEELEYRFLGRSLIIRDVDANLVVDYVDNAVPRI